MFIAIVVLLAVVGGLGFFYYRRKVRGREIAAILDDPNPLAVWTYTAEEWRRAVEDEFSWARSDGSSAQIRICETGIYLKTDSQSHLIELASGPKVVTFAGYRGTEGSPLKLRVRWKIVRRDRKSTRLNSSHSQISYAVFCLKKKKKHRSTHSAGQLIHE